MQTKSCLRLSYCGLGLLLARNLVMGQLVIPDANITAGALNATGTNYVFNLALAQTGVGTDTRFGFKRQSDTVPILGVVFDHHDADCFVHGGVLSSEAQSGETKLQCDTGSPSCRMIR